MVEPLILESSKLESGHGFSDTLLKLQFHAHYITFLSMCRPHCGHNAVESLHDHYSRALIMKAGLGICSDDETDTDTCRTVFIKP